MSKKIRKKSKRHGSAGPEPKMELPIPDRRAMEKIMADLQRALEGHEFKSIEEANAFLQEMMASGGPPPVPGLTPLEQAQDVMYEAWSASGKRRVQLALRALEISKDCADAYVLLAEEAAADLVQAKKLYEKGVMAGERALGPQAFEQDAGHFWGILETRPYMRARFGLAHCLWLLGEREQAIEHYQDMLRLNPNDNQGVRYVLINCLLEQGRDLQVEELLKRYKNDAAATWGYSRALWLFRQEGASRKANGSLRKAIEQNRFVSAYLLGRKKLPSRLPPYIGFGDENEAVEYVAGAMRAWRNTAGALEWLSAHAA